VFSDKQHITKWNIILINTIYINIYIFFYTKKKEMYYIANWKKFIYIKINKIYYYSIIVLYFLISLNIFIDKYIIINIKYINIYIYTYIYIL